VAPVFGEDAEISVTQIGETVARVDFTQAHIPANGHPDDVVHSYKYDFVNKSTGLTDVTFKTFSEYYFLPMSETMGYNVSGLQPGTEYEVRICAYDAFGAPQGYQGGWEAGGKESEPLTATFTTQGTAPETTDNFDAYRQGVAPADLLDVDFAGGVISDRAMNRTLAGGANNIAFDDVLGKYVANFAGDPAQAWQTAWSAGDYEKTLDGLTLEAAFKADPITGFVDVVGNMQSAGYGFEITPEGSGFYLEFWCHVGTYKRPKVTGLEYGKWYHAAGVYDGEAVKLYINGNLAAQVPASGKITKPGSAAQNFVVGGDSKNNNGIEATMVGSISAARIYSEPLNMAQVEVLANRELPSIDKTKPIIRIEADLPEYIVISEGAELPAIKAADNSSVVKLTMRVDGVVEGGAQQPRMMQAQSALVTLIEETEIPNAEALALTFGATELEAAAALGVTQIVLTLRATDPAGNVEEVTHTAALFSEAPSPDTTKPVISFDSPLPAYILYGEAATLPEITASDDSGAATLTVGIDGITLYDYTLENLLPEAVYTDGVSPAMTVDAGTVNLAYNSDVRTVVLRLVAEDAAGNKTEENHSVSILLEAPDPEEPEDPDGFDGISAITGSESVALGENVEYSFSVDGDDNRFSLLDIEFKYDSTKLKFESANSAAGFETMIEDGKNKQDEEEAGALTILLLKNDPTGTGISVPDLKEVLNLNFTATAAGTASVEVRFIGASGYNNEKPRGANFKLTLPAAPAQTVISVYHIYDLNTDGEVDYADIAFMQLHYGKTATSDDWDDIRHMDIAGDDGVIDIVDIMQILRHVRANIA
ncbi:MAG: hypothetical protein LBP73_04440, partial [Clostridiales Family XIII bacterium]|nr:hypothetical protein [Clostridiales Family XIII bacterium]